MQPAEVDACGLQFVGQRREASGLFAIECEILGVGHHRAVDRHALASGEVATLAEGAAFFAAPRLSPDGRRLAWLEWRHPNLPWDGTELCLADVAADGGEVLAISRWRNGRAEPFLPGAGLTDFDVAPGEGFIVLCGADSVWRVSP